jgi:hypothetical protein
MMVSDLINFDNLYFLAQLCMVWITCMLNFSILFSFLIETFETQLITQVI